MIHVALQIQQVTMKSHLRIAEDRDGGPGLPRKPVSQKMIYGSTDFFIIRGPGDASDATMCVESQSAVFLKSAGADLSHSAPVFPFARPAVQKMNEIGLQGQFANGGGQLMKLRVHSFSI